MPGENNQGRRPLFGPMSQTAYGLDWQRKAHPSSVWAPIDDAQGASHDARRNLSIGPGIYRGRVVDVVAYAQCYRVLLERQGGVVLCMAMAATGFLPVGPISIQSIGPGSEVYVLRPVGGGYGIILGGIPSAQTAPEMALSDFIHQTSRCGLRIDKVHSAPFGCADHGSIADWSNGRPFDGLSLGEWGAITETGLRQFLDPFMAQCAVDEATGVFAFYHDQLLRLAGYNTQMFSGGNELEIYVDQLETHHYDGFTPYPWEQCGAIAPGVDPYREIDPQDVQFNKPYYGAWEPQNDDQMPFHRSLLFRGYLGQGGKRMVQAPPPNESDVPAAGRDASSGLNTYGDDNQYAALFEENLGLDGRYSLRSAKAIHIVKWPAIPAVKRMMRIENAEGDNEDNYKFAGYEGGGQDHKVTGEIEADSDTPHLQQAAGLMDVHAWVFNWLGAHPFFYHENDWRIQDEADTFIQKVEEPISFGDLADEFYLPRPDAVEQQIDHRYEKVKYFPNLSYIGMHDDGGVVIGDGYGAEIRMCGGHIFLTAPGDIWAKPGRNFNVLAGYDVCLRAKNSMDLSTTEHDLRLKAEHNLHMLGGNSGEIGGVLIECKAPGAYDYQNVVGEDVTMGGFQVKVDKGDATLWASNIYLRTGGGDVQPGSITLDADAGKQTITLQASTIANFVTNTILDNFGTVGNVTVTHLWGAESNIIGSGCFINGFGTFTNSILVEGWVETIGGYFASELVSPQNEGRVDAIMGYGLSEAYQNIKTDKDDAAKAVTDAQAFWQDLFAKYLYAENQAGNDDTITAVHFTFRNPAQYRTDNFQLFEDRWQQMARLSGQELNTWEEKTITGGAEETMPYPGKEPWNDDDTYMQMDLNLYDPEEGISKTRADSQSDYEEPKFKDPEPQPPSKGYLVIV
jgi:hypothetical protein